MPIQKTYFFWNFTMAQSKSHLKHYIRSSLLAMMSLSSIYSYAATTGNISAVSDYYARGLDQTGGVSLQGSIDYQHASGLYLGSFASNVKWYDKDGDGNVDSDVEWDIYGGYATQLNNNLGVDVGLYYLNYPNQTKYNTYEVYAGLNYKVENVHPVNLSAKVHFTPDRNAYLPDPKNQDESAWYITTQADIQLKPSVTLTPQLGYAFGDTFDQERIGGLDEFFTYSLSLTKSFNDGISAKFSYVGIDLDGHDNKVILGLSKSFSF